MTDDELVEEITGGWNLMCKEGIRGTIVDPKYKEQIARIYNVDLSKKVEVTDPYYFYEQDGDLWFCWE